MLYHDFVSLRAQLAVASTLLASPAPVTTWRYSCSLLLRICLLGCLSRILRSGSSHNFLALHNLSRGVYRLPRGQRSSALLASRDLLLFDSTHTGPCLLLIVNGGRVEELALLLRTPRSCSLDNRVYPLHRSSPLNEGSELRLGSSLVKHV